MNIGLVGSPGSGKSELALKLKKDHTIIDGYAQRIEETTKLAAGPWASYLMNFMVANERIQCEIAARRSEQPFISCGTIIESAAYMAMRGASHSKIGGIAEHNRDALIMQTLGLLFWDTFLYDIVFYLPPTQKQEKLTDEQIFAALETFEVEYVILDSPDKAEQALSHIAAKEELETTEADQPAV
jgi:hypothetical protein